MWPALSLLKNIHKLSEVLGFDIFLWLRLPALKVSLSDTTKHSKKIKTELNNWCIKLTITRFLRANIIILSCNGQSHL